MEFSTNRPKESGYYYVIWEEGDDPYQSLVYIWYYPKGTLSKDDESDYWTWGLTENDDPESIELDILEPEKIKFSDKVA